MGISPGKPAVKTKKFEQRLRAIALSYPQTREDHPWGHSAFKVTGKTFLFLAADDLGLRLSVKLGPSRLDALELPYTEPTRYGLGKHGWVSANFGPGNDVPVGMLESWIDESFHGVAPQAVLKTFDRRKKPN